MDNRKIVLGFGILIFSLNLNDMNPKWAFSVGLLGLAIIAIGVCEKNNK